MFAVISARSTGSIIIKRTETEEQATRFIENYEGSLHPDEVLDYYEED